MSAWFWVEIFGDRSRFKGTCYRVAYWLRLGETRGRTRNGWRKRIRVPVADVWLYPLVADFKEALRDDHA